MTTADDFLKTWTLNRGDTTPLTRADAEQMAVQWEADAGDNGIDPAALEQAAGEPLADYILRIFGETDPEPDAR